MDSNTTIKQLKDQTRQFLAGRNWGGYHTPKNLAMSLVIEAAELMEIFQWKTPEESREIASDAAVREHLGEEMADVLAYLLELSMELDIDLATAFADKMVKNNLKYPKEQTHRF